ncbi:MAG: hypothetical protein ACOZAJ_01495 [Patescibacteria group bacterium]
MWEDIVKFLLPIVFTESVPYILFEHGLDYQQTTIISLIIMALKLVVDVFFIRFVLLIIRKLINRLWRLLKIFFWRKNILYIKSWSRRDSKIIEVVSFLGRFNFIYHKPVKAMARLRDKLVNWAIGVGYAAIFILSIVPMVPIVAAAPILAYIALTANKPWYQFNNWLFVALLVGSEIKIIYLVVGLYGF